MPVTADQIADITRGTVDLYRNAEQAVLGQVTRYLAQGTVYVCAAGRCNHNKIGWAGPNKGLGNSKLIGIEMANDNKGEPWPPAQLDAARRATAAIMRRIGADPRRRLAGHYEHQPFIGRPAGEGSTKSDPFGVDMKAERPRVAALMKEDELTPDDLNKIKAAIDARADQLEASIDSKVKAVETRIKAELAGLPADIFDVTFNDTTHPGRRFFELLGDLGAYRGYASAAKDFDEKSIPANAPVRRWTAAADAILKSSESA